MSTAYVLRRAVTARRPTRWDMHIRWALRLPEEAVNLPAGTWLLALPAAAGAAPHPPHYRLADGRVVCMDAPLSGEVAEPLTDPQALVALRAYRPLEEAVAADWGLSVEQVDPTPPFRLIQCPLCGGTAFTTLGFAGAWCDGCQAQFRVRYTAGDPGFVVDCTWEQYQPHAARYLLPRSAQLMLTLVCKGSQEALTLTHTRHCHRADCTPQAVALTAGRTGPLRGGLHACNVGDVYAWSFYGDVPERYNHNRHGYETLLWADGRQEGWPRPAFVPGTGLLEAERRQLREAAALLAAHAPQGRYGETLVTLLQDVAARPTHSPTVTYRSPWPQPQQLQAGEKYLLYRWLLQAGDTSGWVTAVPVWLVVRAVEGDKGRPSWQVVGDNLCPGCGQVVTAEHLAQTVDPQRPWATAHGSCRALWQQQWQPTLFWTPVTET